MKKKNEIIIDKDPKRRLSIWRLMIALLILLGAGYGSFDLWTKNEEYKQANTSEPWFATYVDITATPTYSFEQENINPISNNLILSFIVSSSEDPCEPSWGKAYNFEEARTQLDLDRRIARYRQQNGEVSISFGGLLNDELAVKCKDENKLKSAYQSVIDYYKIDTIDLDLEGNGLKDIEALKRRASSISSIQKSMRENGKSLAVWITLPVAPFGLTEDGTRGIAEMLKADVDLAGVNVMTMDYGESKTESQTMQEASESALSETKRQLDILYTQTGIELSDSILWTKIGATPMIGQNDVPNEVFTLDDANGLNSFASNKGIKRLSMWSANRDIQCGENYVNTKIVSDSCSGIKQERFNFSNIFRKNFNGKMSNNSSSITVASAGTEQKEDNPEESPYQIWNENGTYLQGTKVVWHQNVYEAKWWTQGDLPDNPVLQSWETPWKLIGPVLPGEKPIKQLTLPSGTYPSWSGEEIYDTGDRVLFNKIPYQAKWWTQGDSPAASTSSPDSSPWTALTREQIIEILEK